MRKTSIIIFIVLTTVVHLYSQGFVSSVSKRGTSAAPFLSVGQGARAVGLGGAFVGIANDASATYWNPAGIAELPGGNFMFDHTDWIGGLKYNFLSGSYFVDGLGAIGLSITTSDYGDMNVTTIDEPNGTGEVFSVRDVSFAVTYALKLTDRFSIGFSPKYVYQSIWRMSASAFAFDMGVKYVTPFDDAVIAMSVTNFGTKMQLLGNSALVLYDQDLTSTGNNNKIPAYLETEEWALPLAFRVGIAYQPIKGEFHKLTIAADAIHPSDNYESVNAGAEYSYDNFIFVRAGYKSLFLKDSEEGAAFGFGIRQEVVNGATLIVDYAYQDFGRLKNIQKFSVGLKF